MAQSGDVILQQGGMRKLSTRDKKLVQALTLTDSEMLADQMKNNSASNISELLREMDMQKNPKNKAVLLSEYNKILQNVEPWAPDPSVQIVQKQSQDPMSFLDKIISIFK
jgi:membrane-bound ClpP family serine protease